MLDPGEQLGVQPVQHPLAGAAQQPPLPGGEGAARPDPLPLRVELGEEGLHPADTAHPARDLERSRRRGGAQDERDQLVAERVVGQQGDVVGEPPGDLVGAELGGTGRRIRGGRGRPSAAAAPGSRARARSRAPASSAIPPAGGVPPAPSPPGPGSGLRSISWAAARSACSRRSDAGCGSSDGARVRVTPGEWRARPRVHATGTAPPRRTRASCAPWPSCSSSSATRRSYITVLSRRKDARRVCDPSSPRRCSASRTARCRMPRASSSRPCSCRSCPSRSRTCRCRCGNGSARDRSVCPDEMLVGELWSSRAAGRRGGGGCRPARPSTVCRRRGRGPARRGRGRRGGRRPARRRRCAPATRWRAAARSRRSRRCSRTRRARCRPPCRAASRRASPPDRAGRRRDGAASLRCAATTRPVGTWRAPRRADTAPGRRPRSRRSAARGPRWVVSASSGSRASSNARNASRYRPRRIRARPASYRQRADARAWRSSRNVEAASSSRFSASLAYPRCSSSIARL